MIVSISLRLNSATEFLYMMTVIAYQRSDRSSRDLPAKRTTRTKVQHGEMHGCRYPRGSVISLTHAPVPVCCPSRWEPPAVYGISRILVSTQGSSSLLGFPTMSAPVCITSLCSNNSSKIRATACRSSVILPQLLPAYPPEQGQLATGNL